MTVPALSKSNFNAFANRNFGDYFTEGYNRLSTSDLLPDFSSDRSNDSSSSREAELARFQRMASSMSSYPNPSRDSARDNIARS